jgi:DNA repair photolyase
MPKSRTSSRRKTPKKTPLSLSVKLPPRRVRERFLVIYELEGCKKAVNYLSKYYGVRRMRIVLNGKKVGKWCLGMYLKNCAYFKKEGLTRKMLQVCDELSYPVFIVTKSDLVARDIDVLSSLAKRNLVAINLTITAVNSKILKKLEPCSPSNKKRLEAMKTLTQAGVPCNLYLSPIFPILSDNLLNYYVKKANDCGARCCAAVPLKIRPVIWRGVEQFLQANVPTLVDQYKDLYFKHGTKDLSGYHLPELTYRRKIAESIAEKCKELNMNFTAEGVS